MNNKYEPTLEVSLTLQELRAVVKSLSIGADQLAKKVQRLGANSKADDIASEYLLLFRAKAECESVLACALSGEDS
jgi:hypothetical protein